MLRHPIAHVLLLVAAATAACAQSVDPSGDGGRAISQGAGVVETANLYACPGGANYRPSPTGTVKSRDGRVWAVPAETAFTIGPHAPDLYNECTGVTPAGVEEVDLGRVPVVEVDPGGELITGYLIADNYFELYVNGKLVATDATPFTPFNSAVVRFRAKRPVTYAVKLVDWEETVGLGVESGGGGNYHPGDGGFIAAFSDGTRTGPHWRAQSFYIAPLASPQDVVERDGAHLTPNLATTYPEAPAQVACAAACYALHYAVPQDWAAVGFDDSAWPSAKPFSERAMGVDRLPAMTRFRPAFEGARVIWSNNLVLDNLVIARTRGQ